MKPSRASGGIALRSVGACLLASTFGCGGDSPTNEWRCLDRPDLCPGEIQGVILAEEEELAAGNWGTGDAASDPLRMLRESGYIGTLRIFDYGRWPPFSTGVGESLAQFFRFFYPANIGGGYAFAMQNVRVGPHWIMVSFRPVCSSSSVASHGDGDLLSRSPCTGHCDLREAGKGVPYIEITEENPVVRDVVVRLNAVYRNPDDTTGGGSKCN